MKVQFLVMKGKAKDVAQQLKNMTEEEFEALKQEALNRKGVN